MADDIVVPYFDTDPLPDEQTPGENWPLYIGDPDARRTYLTTVTQLRRLFGPRDLAGPADPRLGTPGRQNQRYYHLRTLTLADLYVYDAGGWGEPLIVGFLLALPTSPGAPLPTVTLSAVGTATVGIAVQLSATASSTTSPIAQVEFFAGATSLGVVQGAGPYGVGYTPTATGTFYLTAKATDANGQSKVSLPKLLVVNAPGTPTNLKPIITLTLTPANVVVGQATTFNAAANDPDGPAPSVAFYVGPTLLATVLATPYVASYVPTAVGTYVINAVATDNQGASTTVFKTLTVTAAVTIITPDAPTQTSDDTTDQQDFDTPYGKAALLVSLNDAQYGAYAGPYNVGNVFRAPGYFKSKVSAAPGRAESAVTSSPQFNVAAVVTPPDPTTNPSYHGTTASAAPSPAQVAALTSESWAAAARAISFDASQGNGVYLVFAEPASYGVRATITDVDGDNVTATFTRSAITISGVAYNQYITNLANYDNPAILLTFATPS